MISPLRCLLLVAFLFLSLFLIVCSSWLESVFGAKRLGYALVSFHCEKWTKVRYLRCMIWILVCTYLLLNLFSIVSLAISFCGP